MIRSKRVKYVDTYDSLAEEYYESERHPTCKNMRDASALVLRRLLIQQVSVTNTCEIGAGFSLLAEICIELFGTADGILVTDASIRMLEHSRSFVEDGVHLLVAEAERLPFAGGSMSVMVSVLGDSYNTPRFWSEVARLLKPGGRCIFTVPSYDWAQSFRSVEPGEIADCAYFEMRGGVGLYVPSYIYPEEIQVVAIETVGLSVREILHTHIEDLPRPISPKLEHLYYTGSQSPVTGYLIEKPAQK